MTNDMHLDEKLFNLFVRFFKEKSGLNFNSRNHYLLEQGIINRIKEIGIKDAREYYQHLQLSTTGQKELDSLLSEITINETFFFRNQPHFKAIEEYVLPEIIKKNKYGGKRIKIWSAGCSSGEEPYSIAILLKKFSDDFESWNIDIIATDIDKRILEKAKKGIYKKRSLRNMKEDLKKKYFKRDNGAYFLTDDVRQMVDFRYLNLLQPEKAIFGDKHKFDLIFCRNVLIYFDIDTQKRVLNFFYKSLSNEGFMFLGHSETLQNMGIPFISDKYRETFFYRKVLNQEKRKQIKNKLTKNLIGIGSDKMVGVYSSNEQGDISKDNKGIFARQGEISFRSKKERMPEEYLKAANDAFIKEKHQVAKEELERYLQVRPTDPEALFLLARVHLELGDKEKAMGKCKAALKEDPLMAEARFFLGIIWRDMGKMDEALVELGKAIYIDKKFALAYFYRGRIFEASSVFKRAVKDYKIAVDILKGESADNGVDLIKGINNAVLIEACERNISSLEEKNG